MITFEEILENHIARPSERDNIKVGLATVIGLRSRKPEQVMWVLPGGRRTTSYEEAEQTARQMDQLFCDNMQRVCR